MPAGNPRLYLAYGSNLHPRRLEERVGDVRLITSTQLRDWSLRFDKRGGDGSAKANLHPAPGSGQSVGVALYELTLDQVRILDRYEGCGRGYETISLSISVDGDVLSSFAYLAPSQWLSDQLLPFDWYVALIREGARFHGFESAVLRKLDRQATRIDSKAARARAELSNLGLTVPTHYRM